MAKKTMARGDGHQRKFAKPKSKILMSGVESNCC